MRLPAVDEEGSGTVSEPLEFVDLGRLMVAERGNLVADLRALGPRLLNQVLALALALMGFRSGSGLPESPLIVGNGMDDFESH